MQVTFDTMETFDSVEQGKGKRMRASSCLQGGVSYCLIYLLVVSWLVAQSLGSLGPLIVRILIEFFSQVRYKIFFLGVLQIA